MEKENHSGLSSVLRMEKIRTEQIIAVIRLGFFGVLLAANLMGHILRSTPLHIETYIILGALVFSLFAFMELRVIQRRLPLIKQPEGRLQYLEHGYYALIILFDIAILTAFVISAFQSAQLPAFAERFPYTPTVIYAGGFTFLAALYLVLDIFRFSTVTTAYSAALFIGLYFGCSLLLDIPVDSVLFLRSTQIFLSTVAAMGVICFLISREISRVIILTKQQEQLERFLPQATALEYIRSRNAFTPGGEKQLVTIVFIDIRGFTSMSEQLSPQQTIDFLNSFFARMAAPIFAHHGILDKYLGDGMMALFGAPHPGAADADNAVAATLAMRRALAEYNQELQGAGAPDIRICIGIHTGEVILGNIGTEQRMDYTAIGDAVNTASRLEQLNRETDTTILMSERTRAALQQTYQLEDLGMRRVKGRNRPVHIYSLP